MTSKRSLPAIAYYNVLFPHEAIGRWLKSVGLCEVPFKGVTADDNYIAFSSFQTAYAAARKGDIVEMHLRLQPDSRSRKYSVFILDFDINECLPRACCGTQKRLCNTCLPVVQQWGIHLKTVVSHLLCVDIQSVFSVLSGGKGIHIWAKMPFPVYRPVWHSYYDRLTKCEWMNRLMFEITEFVLSVPLEYLKHALTTHGTPVFQASLKNTTTHTDFLRVVLDFRRRDFPGEDYLDAVAFIYSKAFPIKYDEKVVKSETHDIRLPMSVNYGAGDINAHRIAVLFSSSTQFNTITDLPTIENIDVDNAQLLEHAFDNVM